MAVTAERREQIAILDFGSQYSHLIARSVRESEVFCELYSCLVHADVLRQHHVRGIILSGGPSSVYDPESPHVDRSVWEFIREEKIPVLGICYGMQELAHHFGGAVAPSSQREFGRAHLSVNENLPREAHVLFEGVEGIAEMWMSHGDKVILLPPGWIKIAHTANSEHAAVANLEKNMYGLQFHPEVTHSVGGKTLLKNFVLKICSSTPDWDMRSIAEEFIHDLQTEIGPTSHVIGAVSGGVDSSVAALLLKAAIGDRFHAIMVDTGCLRKDEAVLCKERLQDHLGINLTVVDASNRFLHNLLGVSDPEKKRKIIGGLFIDVFQEEALKIDAPVDYLLQGTLYPDVIESISYRGPSMTIKTHHNVGGLPEKMNLKLLEPLRELFKDEVRSLGIALGLDPVSVWRHPFPGPGLAIRILGEVTRERVAMLQAADAILIEELMKEGIYNEISQALVVLLPVQSVGVMGDCRTYEQPCVVRCVTSTDFMTADFYHMDHRVMGHIASRITNEVRGINRVCYDVSSKPPATIEWE